MEERKRRLEELQKTAEELSLKQQEVSDLVEKKTRDFFAANSNTNQAVVNLGSVQDTYNYASSHPDISRYAIYITRLSRFRDRMFNRDLKLLDKDSSDSEVEIKRVNLVQQRTENKVNLQSDLHQYLSNTVLGTHSAGILKAEMDASLIFSKCAKNSLIDSLKNEGEIKKEIKKNEENIMDLYANPSLEMPSYIEPED